MQAVSAAAPAANVAPRNILRRTAAAAAWLWSMALPAAKLLPGIGAVPRPGPWRFVFEPLDMCCLLRVGR
ncbi:hypothetical protein GCM10009569_14720 [Arthrobacter russicus]